MGNNAVLPYSWLQVCGRIHWGGTGETRDREIITFSYTANMPSSTSWSVFTTLGRKPNMAQIGWYKETVNNNTSQTHTTHRHTATKAELLTAKRQAVKHTAQYCRGIPINFTGPHKSSQVKSMVALTPVTHTATPVFSLKWVVLMVIDYTLKYTGYWIKLSPNDRRPTAAKISPITFLHPGVFPESVSNYYMIHQHKIKRVKM